VCKSVFDLRASNQKNLFLWDKKNKAFGLFEVFFFLRCVRIEWPCPRPQVPLFEPALGQNVAKFTGIERSLCCSLLTLEHASTISEDAKSELTNSAGPVCVNGSSCLAKFV
jgi:hypothetical protein